MNKTIYIAYAKEDKKQYDQLVNELMDFEKNLELVSTIEKNAYKAQWKSEVRTKMRNATGVIVLVSKHTLNSSAQKFEINAALEEGKPILSISAYKNDRARMMGLQTKAWDEAILQEFVNKLK